MRLRSEMRSRQGAGSVADSSPVGGEMRSHRSQVMRQSPVHSLGVVVMLNVYPL